MVRVELVFYRVENPLIEVNVSRVPCVGEEIEFADDYADKELAGRSFDVKQVSFQVSSSVKSIPLLVVEEG